MPADEAPPEPAAEVVTLIQEDGTERRFRLHDAFDIDGNDYYLVEAEDDPDLVLVLREEEGALMSVEGDEFDRVMRNLENESEQ